MRKSFRKTVLLLGTWALVLALLPLGGVTRAPAARAAEDGINRAALFHDSHDDLYRTPLGAVPTQSRVTLRLRTAADNVDAVILRLWDDFAQEQTLLPMQRVATTPQGYDLWEAAFDVGKSPTLYWYRFIVRKGNETLYYEDDSRVGPDETYDPANEGGAGAVYETSPDLSWQISVYAADYYTPQWMRDAVVYQIFPDRFRNGDPTNDPADGELTFYDGQRSVFHETWNEPPLDPRQPGPYHGRWNVDFFGGDLAGVIEKLDYLQALGVTAIYFNPIFEARSNHRYDTADYKRIDPMLGDLETFRELVEEAQKRGIVIVLDGVFNHMSSDSPFFDRYRRYEAIGACESLDSPYRNWFFFVPPKGQQPSPCVDNPQGATYYISWAGFDSIPKINNENPGPRLYFYLGRNSVVNTWGREGIFGWRLDVGGDIDSGPESDFWEGFRVAVRNTNPEAVIIGEEWGNASRWLLGDEWDAVMNYRLRIGILGFVRQTDFHDNDSVGDRTIRALTPAQFDAILRDIASDYPPMAFHAMMNVLGTHDTSRLFFVVEDTQHQKLAALLQFALPGAPTIYYGDEIALNAPSVDDGGTVQDDPYNRAPYPWPDTEGDAYGPPDEDMLAFYQQLAALRHANPALREGELITLRADTERGVYAFLRLDRAAGNVALVVLNNSDQPQRVSLQTMFRLPAGLTLQPTFGGQPISTDAGFVVLDVPALGGNIWTATAPTLFSAPPTPANVDAQGQNGAVTLRWDAVPEADYYLVYRSPVAEGGFERVSWIVEEPQYTDTDVTNGYRTYYAVAAVSAAGVVGELSAAVPAIPSAPIQATAYLMDDQPQEVTLHYGSAATVRASVRVEGMTEAEGAAPGVRAEAALAPAEESIPAEDWVPMQYVGEQDGADVYEAHIPLEMAGDFVLIARFSSSAGESWTVATRKDGTFPPLHVSAPQDTEPPAPPAAAQIAEASLKGVLVSWEASPSEDVAAYRLYRTEGRETQTIADVPADGALQYFDRAVTAGSRYSYSVTAVDAALNESEPTEAGEARVQRRGIPVTFNVTVPDYTQEGPGKLYIAGDFGTDALPFWDPAGLEMTQIDEQHWTITLELPEGTNIEYKYVRGTWNAVEKGPECEEIANRRLKVEVPTGEASLTVDDVVAKWRDLDKCG